MKKVCTVCKLEKNILSFGKNKRMEDGINYVCKECHNKSSKKSYKNQTPLAHAKKVFSGIEKRCTNKKYQEHRPKYHNVENLLNKELFIEWYVTNYFSGCEVDRIDDNGNYEMSNIQLLSKEEHNRKRKIERDGNIQDGLKKCNRCNEIKPETIEFYSVHKRNVSQFNPLGLRGICKECLNKQRAEYYKKTKG